MEIINVKYVQTELMSILTQNISIDYDGGQETVTLASSLKQDGESIIDFCTESPLDDSRSRETLAMKIIE